MFQMNNVKLKMYLFIFNYDLKPKSKHTQNFRLSEKRSCQTDLQEK